MNIEGEPVPGREGTFSSTPMGHWEPPIESSRQELREQAEKRGALNGALLNVLHARSNGNFKPDSPSERCPSCRSTGRKSLGCVLRCE